MLFVVVYVANRLPHSSPGSKTPYSKLFGKNADMSALQAIGSRAFVHTDTYTSEFQNTMWVGIRYRQNANNKEHCTYMPSTCRALENRSVTFIETLFGNSPLRRMENSKSARTAFQTWFASPRHSASTKLTMDTDARYVHA